MKKIYKLMQGNFTASGCGDAWEVESFNTLKEARAEMKRISKDTKGIAKHPGGFVNTFIDLYVDGVELEEPALVETVDGVKYYY